MTWWGPTGEIVGGYGANFTFTVPPPMPEVPLLVGSGPAEWSTCAELEPDPVLIHDGNMYYRILGLRWPFRNITRGMLREAYMSVGGADNAFATYAVKRLLDDELRSRYDRMPLGLWMVDHYVRELFKRKAAAEEVRRRQQRYLGGHIPTIDDVLEGWGLCDSASPTSNEPVADGGRPLTDRGQDPSAVSDRDDTVRDAWPWSYFRWRSRCQDTERLARWQRLLLAAAREAGLRTRLAVGFVGRHPSDFVRVAVAGRVALLLHQEAEPTPELAAMAVDFELHEMTRMIG